MFPFVKTAKVITAFRFIVKADDKLISFRIPGNDILYLKIKEAFHGYSKKHT